MQRRFSDEQIVDIVQEHEASGATREICRKYGIASTTLYRWKAKYGGMTRPEVAKIRGLEDENRRLKRLLAETMLDNAALKDLLKKNF